jgi:hypothetical protein
MESRTIGESGKGEGLPAYAEERKEKERHCGNRKSQAPVAQSCQSIKPNRNRN